MTKEQFVETISYMQEFVNLIDELRQMGIDLIESKLYNLPANIFDQFVYSHFTEFGQDLVFWWMYEDVPKEITLDDGKVHDVEDVNDFYEFLVENEYVL